MNPLNEFSGCKPGMVQISESMLMQMYADIHELVHMHGKLISLYEEEAELKKRHRAYLHVRDHADDVCRVDKRRIEEICEHYDAIGRYHGEHEMPEVFGVFIFPYEEDFDKRDAQAVESKNESMKSVDDFFHMLMDVLMDEVSKQKKE